MCTFRILDCYDFWWSKSPAKYQPKLMWWVCDWFRNKPWTYRYGQLWNCLHQSLPNGHVWIGPEIYQSAFSDSHFITFWLDISIKHLGNGKIILLLRKGKFFKLSADFSRKLLYYTNFCAIFTICEKLCHKCKNRGCWGEGGGSWKIV